MLEQLKSQLATYYASHSSASQPASLVALEPLTSGWAGSVYAFTLHYHGMERTYQEALVLKTYAPTDSGRKKVVREWQALAHLGAAGYPVPHVKHLEPDSRYLGSPFLVMEQVPGRPLWDVREQADQPEQDSLTKVFVDCLVALHALDPRLLGPALELPTPYVFVERELAELRRAGERSTYHTLSSIVDWLELRKHSVPCLQPAILHRDYHPWNVLVDGPDRRAVIDWDWQIGDFRFDVAWTCTLMHRSGFQAWSMEVRRAYAQQSDRALTEFEYFEVLTSLRWLLNVTHSLQTGENLRSAASTTFRDFLVTPVRNAVALMQERTGLTLQVEL